MFNEVERKRRYVWTQFPLLAMMAKALNNLEDSFSKMKYPKSCHHKFSELVFAVDKEVGKLIESMANSGHEQVSLSLTTSL